MMEGRGGLCPCDKTASSVAKASLDLCLLSGGKRFRFHETLQLGAKGAMCVYITMQQLSVQIQRPIRSSKQQEANTHLYSAQSK